MVHFPGLTPTVSPGFGNVGLPALIDSISKSSLREREAVQVVSSLITGAFLGENSIQYVGTPRAIGFGITTNHRTRHPVPCYLD